MRKKESQVSYLLDDNVKFCVRSVKIDLWLKYRDSQNEMRQHAVIVLKNYKNKREVVHPITQFIFEKWKFKRYNTQKKHADNLVKFLNWVLVTKRRTYKICSLRDLTPLHGSGFLNELTRQQKARGTVQSAERTLTEFYYYLAKKGYLNELTKSDFVKQDIPQVSKKNYILTPFKGVIKPAYSQSNIAHMIPEKYILPFLEVVVQNANPIALGVYMQIFGGIRQGELVNIQRGDITPIGVFGEDGVIVKLRNKMLREDIKDGNGSASVKKERNQIVFSIGDWLKILYTNHLNNYCVMDGSDALFVNRDGKAMSGRSYRYFFNKAKHQFLDILKHSNNPDEQIDALKLREYKWSTHIGRGIFTNLLAEEAQNPYDIALPRGDSNLSSSLVYQGNTLRMKENLERRMDDLYKGYLPGLLR
ncbi:hypothetical protein ACT7DC_22555 [Bacillus cereus]